MQIDEAYEKYFGVIYKTCMMYLKNPADAEDAVSETFLKLIRQKEPFESEEHLRRWLFVTAKNDCKNRLSHWWRKSRADSEALETAESESEYGETLHLLLELPVKYREALTFVYILGYTGIETAEMLSVSESTLYTRLKRGRELLKLEIES
ncbi:MAG TPA: RNA polymerase sigma factor [Oscillospiraceae bacterium]|nr:RNA polymerase sigma factor [Oscillospiraceae bacterium]HPF56789.1 RNA polymerase sigma factor [Clostridiales bacterium]HPK35765.1 RNA polymerase sigma factor [Oscillospiraceae bacterium]HPR75385.1 RNA polymerase sigma factor [Oscillospiraceae bacterium]